MALCDDCGALGAYFRPKYGKNLCDPCFDALRESARAYAKAAEWRPTP